MSKIITELKQEVTTEQVKKMAKIEGLIMLRQHLETDRESLEEIVSEVFQQRADSLEKLGVDNKLIVAAIQNLFASYTLTAEAAEMAQFEAMKTD